MLDVLRGEDHDVGGISQRSRHRRDVLWIGDVHRGHSIGSLRPSSFRSSLTTAGDVGAGLARGSGAGSGRSSTSGAGAGGLGFAIRAGIATRPTGDEVVDATPSEGRYMFPAPLTYARYTNVAIARAIKGDAAATIHDVPPPLVHPMRCRHCRNLKRRVRKSSQLPVDRRQGRHGRTPVAMDLSAGPNILELYQKPVNITTYDTKWIPTSARFVVLGSYARATGCLQIYSLDTENEGVKLNKELEKKAAFKCGTFGASSLRERHLATGNFEGYLQLWDSQRLEKLPADVKAHTSIVNAIDGAGGQRSGYGPPELVTGGRDGCVRVWDVRQKDAPVAIFEPAEGVKARIAGASQSATPSTTKSGACSPGTTRRREDVRPANRDGQSRAQREERRVFRGVRPQGDRHEQVRGDVSGIGVYRV